MKFIIEVVWQPARYYRRRFELREGMREEGTSSAGVVESSGVKEQLGAL